MLQRADDFLGNLTKASLRPAYLFSGNEPLQVTDCHDALLRHCRKNGYSERIVFDAEINLDWQVVQSEIGSLSLFATQRIIEIRLHKRSPGAEGANVLSAFCSQSDPADILIVTMEKLDKKMQQSAWFKSFDKCGVIVQVWSPAPGVLPQWLIRRARGKGIELTNAAAVLLAEQTEGNLLAADQELERIALVHEETRIDCEHILSGTVDSTRYDVFNLIDSALSGDLPRTIRVLRGLRAEGTEPVLINWAVTRELRSLYLQAKSSTLTGSDARRIPSFGGGATRQKNISLALRRHSASDLAAMLLVADRADQIIKGARPGNAWVTFASVLAWLAGRERPKLWERETDSA